MARDDPIRQMLLVRVNLLYHTALTAELPTAACSLSAHRAEEEDKEQRTARGQWGSEGDSVGAGRTAGRDPFGMASIDDTARRYEARGGLVYGSARSVKPCKKP